MVHSIRFFVQAFKIVVRSWKFSRLLLYILWDDWPIFDHLTWIEHQFLSGIRDSSKILWGMMRLVGRVRKSEHQSWLAKRLGLGLICWGFKGVQEEIPSEEARNLQIRSVAFPPGQYTSPQLHPCHRLFD